MDGGKKGWTYKTKTSTLLRAYWFFLRAMSLKGSFLLGVLLLVSFLQAESKEAAHVSSFNRSSFPTHFVFGAASSSYQYEGAAFEGGKGQSIWDTFTREYSGKILDHQNGDVADDFYHRYKGDVQLLKTIGLDGFRFSISWPRILPRGKISGGVNKEGIAFYNDLINNLISNGIKPFATLFHWDLPQALEDEYGGWLSPKIMDDFGDFAEICFKEFGDRVKYWATMNEPWTFVSQGYDAGALAPGRCSGWMNVGCAAGNSATEPYLVGHNMLLSHAAVVKLYKEKYQGHQKGQIGIVLVSHWFVPYSNSKSDIKAAKRALDFMYGWFIHPLTYGDYPKNMRQLVGRRLPKFSKEEALQVKGSFDYLGLNYYTSNYAANLHSAKRVNLSFTTDSQANLTTERNGKPIGATTGVSIFYVYPKGLKELLLYTKENYKNPTIYITECGMGDANITTVEQGVNDIQRKHFYQGHLSTLRQAIQDGVNVKGFFAWSFLDTFEWGSGYTQKFGIVHVHFSGKLERHLKVSAYWFKKFLS